MSEQRQNTSVPQVNQDTNRGIEERRDMIPKHVGSPQVTEIQIPFYPDSIMKPPPRPPNKIAQNDRQINLDLDLEINKDFEENSPYQEEVISEIYQRPDKSQLVESLELTDLVDTDKIVWKYLPKETDIEKILNVTQRKVLKETHLAITIKEIQAGYLKVHISKMYTCILVRISFQVQKVLYKKLKYWQRDIYCWIHYYSN